MPEFIFFMFMFNPFFVHLYLYKWCGLVLFSFFISYFFDLDIQVAIKRNCTLLFLLNIPLLLKQAEYYVKKTIYFSRQSNTKQYSAEPVFNHFNFNPLSQALPESIQNFLSWAHPKVPDVWWACI